MEVVILEKRIDILRKHLHKLLNNNANFQRIYEISVKLDSLIVMHHRKLHFDVHEKEEKDAV